MHANGNLATARRIDEAPLHAIASRPVVILDGTPMWEAATKDLHVLAPADLSEARIAALDPSRVIANLASPGVLASLATLREWGCRARFWGCLADAAVGRGLPLGPLEPVARPLDPERVAMMLGPLAPRGARVVTVGADIDSLVSLRYTLTRQGLSVAMAWDARQAADILPLVRPDVVVLDLGLPGAEGYGILAGLGGVEPAPMLALVSDDEDPAARLAAALGEPAHGARAVPLGRVLEKLGDPRG